MTVHANCIEILLRMNILKLIRIVGYSIMCQLGDGRYATSPSDEDLYAINHLYE